MIFDQFLTRADDETLQQILGSRVIKLLGILDRSLLTPSKLRTAMLNLYSRDELLLKKKSRVLLLDLLRPSEAEALARLLNAKGEDVYAALKSTSIGTASKSEKLFAFFELTVTPTEEAESQPEHKLIRASYPLFSHQNRAACKVIKNLYKEPHRVMLHMPTGAGKTRTAMHVIADHLKSKEETIVVWLAHNEELCEQAASEFEAAWSCLGNRDTSIYRFWGDNTPDLSNISDGIVVAGLPKIYSRAKQSIAFISKLGKKCSLVIMDEAHQAIAPTYQLILDALVLPFPRTALLGLSATPGRTWSDVSADEKLADFFSRRKVTLKISGYANPLDYLVEEKYLARVTYKPLFNQSGIKLSAEDLDVINEQLDLPQRILKALADDEKRNLRIIIEIEALTKRHNRIIVFALSVEHSNLLAATLQVRGIDAKSVTGSTPPSVRQNTINDYKSEQEGCKILCNFGVLTTGFDAPKTSAAVIARPTTSLVLYSQMIGRAIRGVKAGGNEEAEIVTVIDTDLPAFGNVAEAFTNWEDIWEGVEL